MGNKTSIEYIRRKAPKAKIGGRVTYAGHPYRIANTHHDGLVLRSQLHVHANEEIIRYRHGRSLPTVITCNVDQRALAAMWGDRTADVIFERAHWITMGGQKLRRVSSAVESF